MEVTKHYCRFCLERCVYLQTIDKTHCEILNAFALTLNLTISNDPVVCKKCAEHLYNCKAFKIVSQEVSDDLVILLNGQVIAVDTCLFCKKSMVFSPFLTLNSGALDILLLRGLLEQYFPELNLHTKMKPVICPTCYEPLQKTFNFIINCLSVEEQIKKYCKNVGTNSKGQIELENVLQFVAENPANNADNFDAFNTVKVEENCMVYIKDKNSENMQCDRSVKLEDGDVTSILPSIVKVESVSDGENTGGALNQRIKLENVDESKTNHKPEEFDMEMIKKEFKIEEQLTNEESENTEEMIQPVGESLESVIGKSYGYGNKNGTGKRKLSWNDTEAASSDGK